MDVTAASNDDHSARYARKRAWVLGSVVALAVASAAVAPGAHAASPAKAKAAKATVVSLTFDDSDVDQMTALSALQASHLNGTFFTISGSVGTPGYLSLAQLQQIYADGNEIGGHTVNHLDLTTVSADEAKRQVCDARNQLTSWGFPQTSFAYPDSTTNAAVQTIVKNCGYNSARSLGDVQTRFGCAGCVAAETIPPAKPYALRAPDEVDDTWTLADLESTVTNAEAKGGWDILTFHHICDGCDTSGLGLDVDPGLFAQFTTWLAAHVAATPTTTVKTVTQVVGGTVKKSVTAPAPPAVSGSVTNSSLETVSTLAGVPSCWSAYAYGDNTPTFAEVAPGHTGKVAEQLTVTGYSDGDAKLMPTLDTGGCSPGVTAGHSYQVGAWYTSTVPVQFDIYYRTATGGFLYLTSSPYFPVSSTYTQALYTTPPMPAGATGLSYGLAVFSNGTVTTDDYSFADAATVPPPPVQTALGNASLETPGINGLPQCWTAYAYGTNSPVFAETSAAHTGTTAESLTVSGYASGDAKLMPTLDTSACAPAATPGHTYALGAWYTSTGPTQFELYTRDASGTWSYWTSSPWLAATATYAQAAWTTPAVPAGTTALSFGLNVFGNGSLVTDDYTDVQAS